MSKEEIEEILKKHDEIRVAYLYGSIVKGYGRKGSDIDVGLLLREDFAADALYPARIAREIKEGCKLDREVDVRILDKRALIFLHQVLKYGTVVFTKDESKRIEFESEVYDRYLDYKPYFDHFNEVRRKRLLS